MVAQIRKLQPGKPHVWKEKRKSYSEIVKKQRTGSTKKLICVWYRETDYINGVYL